MTDTSCADLAELEYEFASDPNSEAFIPLAEAYRNVGRYIEAMVVCKKGIKAYPDLPTGRIIMAHIYNDQGKHQKAINELMILLKGKPDNCDACCLLGNVYLKLGRKEEGIGFLKKALDADPNNQQAREALLKMGIDQVPGKQTTRSRQRAPDPRTKDWTEESPGQKTVDQDVADGSGAGWTEPESTVPASLKGPAAVPKRRIADIYQAMEVQRTKPKQRSMKFTLYLVGFLGLVLIVYIIYTWWEGIRQEEINQHLKSARPFFNRDTYGGYNKALEQYREILKLDSKHAEALARGAFICSVLVGEHSGDRQLIDEGTKYINKAVNKIQSSAMLTSARSLIILYGGGIANDAIKLLEDGLKTSPTSALLHTSLGFVLLKKGELDTAKDHLLQGAQQNEIRAFVGLGRYARRRSMYRESQKAYSMALQVERDHIGALLEKSMLALVWGETAMYNKQVQGDLGRFEKDLKMEASEKQKAEATLIKLVLEMRNTPKKRSDFSKLRKFAKIHNNNAFFQFLVAREMRRNGLVKGAKETIQKALRLDSSRPNFLLEEAEVYLVQKDWEAARSRALRVQELDSKSGQNLLIVGQAYLGEGNFKKAKKYFKDATKFDDVSGKARRMLADVYLRQPRPDEDLAQAQLEPAIKELFASGEYRESAQSAVKLAKIYAKKNLRSKFVATLKEAQKADPTLAEPNCLIAANIDTSTNEGKTQAIEFCRKCVKLDLSGKFSIRCKEKLNKAK